MEEKPIRYCFEITPNVAYLFHMNDRKMGNIIRSISNPDTIKKIMDIILERDEK